MKNIACLVFFLYAFVGHAQITLIPDPNFEEALIDLGIDSDGVINGQVLTADVEGVTELLLEQEGIEDLTGIEDFVALEALDCAYNWLESIDLSNNAQLEFLRTENNPLTTLDVSFNSQLKYLYCDHNLLTILDVTQNPLLEQLSCSNEDIDIGGTNLIDDLDLSGNPLLTSLYVGNLVTLGTLDVSNNPELRRLSAWNCDLDSIDLSNNPDLEWLFLGIGYNETFNPFRSNNITSLDLTNNPSLTRLEIQYTRITSLDLRNGNNSILTQMIALESLPEFNCIQVDDAMAANNGEPPYDSWNIEPWMTYGDDGTCVLGIADFNPTRISVYPNPVNDLLSVTTSNPNELLELKLFDVTGRYVFSKTTDFERIDLSGIPNGLFVLEIQTNEGVFIEKIVKE